ncbi:MAG: OmpA family protein [Pseudomonadota bacterium]
MRFLLILVLLAALCGLAWHTVKLGTNNSKALGAPQIQAIVDTGVKSAIADPALDAVTVMTDGRNVTLTGEVSSQAVRDAILARASQVYLLGRLTDNIEILSVASPFTFSAVKADGGAIELSGYVPRADVRDAVFADAESAADGAKVAGNVVLASGVPEGDWAALPRTGLKALAKMTSGSLKIVDKAVTLTGDARDKVAVDEIAALVAAAPMGEWWVDVTGAPPPEGFLFNAMKAPDGSILVEGHAPDDQTKTEILALAEALSGQPTAGDLTVAAGMPDADWPSRVKQGLEALQAMDNGVLSVAGLDVSLSGVVQTDADRARLDPLVGEVWTTEVSVLNPTPPGDMTVTLRPDGSTVASGVLPKGMPKAMMFAALPGVDISGLQESEETLEQNWSKPLEGLSIVLPRFQSATARIFGRNVSIDGVLKRGFSASGSEASLRTVLDPSWNLSVVFQELAPLAAVIISKRDSQIAISGVLPQGLAPEDVLDAFGDDAGGDGLTGGGEGDAKAWLNGMTALGDGLMLFDTVNAEVAAGSMALNGTLLPGYEPDEAEAWIDAKLQDGWALDMTADVTEANEGDRRSNLSSGQSESFRRGYWLPDVDFPISIGRCKQEVDAALSDDKINFVTGSAEIDQSGRALLNRLASVSVRCLNSSVIRLEIGGHTDSVGNDENNQKLSEQRAEAVVQAMIDRGVRPDAMQATGFGEAQPIASNDTAEGRAENRRITFEWSESDG